MRGVFLLWIEDDQLCCAKKNKNFIIKWSNQLEIGDADLYIMPGSLRSESLLHHSKSKRLNKSSSLRNYGEYNELVVCYKLIWNNIFTVLLVSLDTPGQPIIFRHESSHIWEASIKG